MLISKKTALIALFCASLVATLLLFNSDRAIAQSDYQGFLDSVRNSSISNCQPQGSGCSDCANDLARSIIEQNSISNKRMQQDVLNAALSGC